MIYRYVFSEWRAIKPVKINQYDITMVTHYDITMGNDIARDVHCEITMSNDVAMCTYNDIAMHNDIAINFFYFVFFAQCLIVLLYNFLLWVILNKNMNLFMFDQSVLENTFFVFVSGYFTYPSDS